MAAGSFVKEMTDNLGFTPTEDQSRLFAALEEFGDIIRDKHGEPVNDEAGEVDAEIGCYIPRDIFYADEQTFIEYISREHYDGLPLVG